jgi:mannose-6-phosphate isomerase-like protein (cupin superfamily)
MNYFLDNIQTLTLENTFFRKVLYTGKFSQLVVMSLKLGEEIGEEVHDNVDQFFRIEQGKAKVIINGKELMAEDDFGFIVPAGSKHNVINTGNEDLKLYTIYSPANHPEGTIHKTKAEADLAEQEAGH